MLQGSEEPEDISYFRASGKPSFQARPRMTAGYEEAFQILSHNVALLPMESLCISEPFPLSLN